MFTEIRTRRLEQELKLYLKVIIGFCAIFCMLLFFLLFSYIKSYGTMVEQSNTLETLYLALSSMTDDMYRFGFSGEESYLKDYEEQLLNAKKHIEYLKQADIGGSYRRNIEDFDTLFIKYLDQQKELVSAFSEEADEENRQYSEEYAKLREIFESMGRRQEILRTKINGAANEQRTKIENSTGVLLALMLAEISLFFMLYWRITNKKVKNILAPIEALTEEANRIKRQDLTMLSMQEQNLQKCHISEINTFSEAFETMLLKIQKQVRELKENARIKEQLQAQEIENLKVNKRLEEQEVENLRVKHLLTLSELRGLQMHMNPHFLFNTLNMIRQYAYLGNSEKTVSLLEETAALLRYNLNYNGKTVTLQQELEGLDHYICLQEERFEDRVSFEFRLDESFHQMKVPCFILQPFVENSISHGMKELNGTLTVQIRTQYLEKEQCGQIWIEDNGSGMNQEKLKKVVREMKQDNWENKKSIGMSNVYKRLMLFTNEKAKIDVFSSVGVGTQIVLQIPYEKSEAVV